MTIKSNLDLEVGILQEKLTPFILGKMAEGILNQEETLKISLQIILAHNLENCLKIILPHLPEELLPQERPVDYSILHTGQRASYYEIFTMLNLPIDHPYEKAPIEVIEIGALEE